MTARRGKETELPAQVHRDLLRCMLRIRRFEEKIVEVYGRQDMKTPVHLCIGQEAVAAGVCANLRQDDYLFTNHRSHGHCLAKGMDPRVMYAEFYGRIDGCCRGKAGSMHLASVEHGILGTSAIVGGGIPHAVGAALACRIRGDDRVAVTFFGDGAVEEGSFHESLNFASLHRLPVVFVCENNLYATNIHLRDRQPHGDIHRKADGHGIPGFLLDGNDVAAVYLGARDAVEAARAGKGPSLLECRTYRWKEHVGPQCDAEKNCRPRQELEEWKARCPVARTHKLLEQRGLLTQPQYRRMLAEIDAELDAAMEYGRNSPWPDVAELTQHLYAPSGED